MQEGRIYRKGSTWMLQYWQPVLEAGKPAKKRVAKKLATYSDKYRTERDVRPLADEILSPINAHTARPESTQTVVSFLEHVYMPHVRESKKPSTARGYLDMYRLVQPHLNHTELREVRTSDIDRFLKSVADSKPRAHTTLLNVKSFLSGAFRYAKRTDLINQNPVHDSVVPRGLPKGETPAYTLQEIQKLLAAIPEPAKTAVLVAGLTGLRVSEIKGLRWEDMAGNELHVQRSVWWGKVTETKTLTSRAPVPLLPLVKRALIEHRKNTIGDGYIFHGRSGKPLRLENTVRRDIKPALAKAGLQWHGWHAFRRGVSTNLHALGADDKTISDILRHSDVEITRQHYIKPVSAKSSKAMRKLEAAFKRAKRK